VSRVSAIYVHVLNQVFNHGGVILMKLQKQKWMILSVTFLVLAYSSGTASAQTKPKSTTTPAGSGDSTGTGDETTDSSKSTKHVMPSTTYSLVCQSADGKSTCTDAQVRDLNAGLPAGRRMHKPLMSVDSVQLSAGGTLTCKQTSGKACTDDQLQAILELGTQSKSIVITKSTDASSTNLYQK